VPTVAVMEKVLVGWTTKPAIGAWRSRFCLAADAPRDTASEA
jgi:hypothetical protein